jgi:hypothetical protein
VQGREAQMCKGILFVKHESGVQSVQITTVHKTRLLMVATRPSVNELFLKFEVIC